MVTAQSTPPSTHKIKTIRRQSSIGAYHEPSHTVTTMTTSTLQQQPLQQQQQQQQQSQPQQQQSSVPISSSTSYYTNSPSPPHAVGIDQLTNNLNQTQELTSRLERTLGGQDIDRQLFHGPVVNNLENFLDTTNLAQFITHSNIDTHSDMLVISRNQFDYMTNKIDQLSKRIHTLEQSLTTDVRLILNLLQAQVGGNKDGSVKTEVHVSKTMNSRFSAFGI